MPVTTSASLGAKLLARLLTAETILGFTGCSMACASGAFALYMNMHGPAGGADGGAHYFTVFAQMTPRARAERAQRNAPVDPVMVAANTEIDPIVTGSIPAPNKASIEAAHRPLSPYEPRADKPVLTNVVLREIDGDSALVEMRDSLMVYKIGEIIPGAGRLIAMTQQDGRPALKTSMGLIVQAP